MIQKPSKLHIHSLMPPSIPEVKQPLKKTKKFTVDSYADVKRGEKIIIYGDTGIGKTSLSLLAPKPVFLDLDEGGSELRNPFTGKKLDYIQDIRNFSDVRSALQQLSIFDNFKTIVIDNATILQDWAESHVVDTIKTDKGAKVKNLLGYGYNKGYKHLYNVMKGPLQDCDELIRRGFNIIFVAKVIWVWLCAAIGSVAGKLTSLGIFRL